MNELLTIWLNGLMVVILCLICLWLLSVYLKNASIVDPFWGLGFIILGLSYSIQSSPIGGYQSLTMILLLIWGLRLSLYLLIRNWGHGEDYRYQKFRQEYGVDRYWWVSFFQVFLLQGILMWLISYPILISVTADDTPHGLLFSLGLVLWSVGFAFEAIGDYQLTSFKKRYPSGKVLDTGLWKYTRHPNYFGDAMVWWGFGFLALAFGSFYGLISAFLMNLLLLKVSGVSLLERTLKHTKPQYQDYIERTSAFFPWLPKRRASD